MAGCSLAPIIPGVPPRSPTPEAIPLPASKPLDAGSRMVDYSTDEWFEEKVYRKAHSVRRFSVSAQRQCPDGGHACHLPRDRTLDHSEGVATETEKAPHLGRTRGP